MNHVQRRDRGAATEDEPKDFSACSASSGFNRRVFSQGFSTLAVRCRAPWRKQRGRDNGFTNGGTEKTEANGEERFDGVAKPNARRTNRIGNHDHLESDLFVVSDPIPSASAGLLRRPAVEPPPFSSVPPFLRE